MIKFIGTPNYAKGRAGYKPEAIVIHIMDGSLLGTDAWFSDPKNQVSAHYGVGVKGEIHQYVHESDTAWHAGRVDKPTWKLLKSTPTPNYYTIGIEHEGKATTVWSEEMKQASAALIKDIAMRWNIPVDRDHVIGHYEIFAKKPDCPAANKEIIDELIALARPKLSTSEIKKQIMELVKQIPE